MFSELRTHLNCLNCLRKLNVHKGNQHVTNKNNKGKSEENELKVNTGYSCGQTGNH